MANYYALMTAIGRSKLADAAANNLSLDITQMALGDGGGQAVSSPTGDETALAGEVYRDALNSLTVAGATFTAELVVPPTVGDWTVRELGLFDADGDLVAYANTPAIDKPSSSGGGVVVDYRPTLTVSIDAPDSVTVIINPAIISASKQWVDDGYLAKHRNLSDVADVSAARSHLGAGSGGGLATLDNDAKVPLAQLRGGEAGGLATLDNGGKLPSSQLPPMQVADTFTAASEAAMLALSADKGDMCVRSDISATFVLSTNDPTVLANWIELQVPASVSSVAGKTGAVTLTKADVGLNNVNNTADANKPVSTAQAAADASSLTAAKAYTDAGIAALSKADVGLGNADNTADADKPVSTAQAAADASVLQQANDHADSAVDTVNGALNTHIADTTAHGATAAATPNRMMRRDANGRTSVATPSSHDHAANKGYVDSKLGKLGLGMTGETWHNLGSGSGTNSHAYPIVVAGVVRPGSYSQTHIRLSIGGLTMAESSDGGGGLVSCQGIVPPGQTYAFSTTGQAYFRALY